MKILQRAIFLVLCLVAAGLLAVWFASRSLAEPVSPALLHEASRAGDLDRVEACLQHGVDVNVQDDAGVTPLHLAALKGHEAVVERLLEYGGRVNAANIKGDTPLHWAAVGADMEVVRELIRHGADSRIRGEQGRVPGAVARSRGHEAVAEYIESFPEPVTVEASPERVPQPSHKVRFASDARSVTVQAGVFSRVASMRADGVIDVVLERADGSRYIFAEVRGKAGTFSMPDGSRIAGLAIMPAGARDGATPELMHHYENPLF